MASCWFYVAHCCYVGCSGKLMVVMIKLIFQTKDLLLHFLIFSTIGIGIKMHSSTQMVKATQTEQIKNLL